MATILKQKMKTVFMPTALALLISACASENLVTQSIKNEAYASSEFYINKADSVKDEEDKITYHLLAVRKLIEENKAEEAQNTFDELTNSPKLMEALQKNEVQKMEYALVSAQLYAARGNNEQAQTLLRNLPLAQLSQVQMLRFYQTQANIAENQRDPVEIVRARSMMNNYLTDNKARQENNDTIWSTLRKGNRATIEQASIKAGEIEFAGWIALITAYNQNVNNPAQMQQAMNNWRAQYPTHSATNLLPSELQSVNSYQQTQLNDIALLLPLSGEAQALGQIVKSGFDEAKGDNPIRIQVLDTDSADPATLVEQAKQNGANLIVGPLLKDRIIMVSGPIHDDMANAIIAQLLFLDAQDPEKDIYMYINSPGGSVTAGLAIYDTMNFIKADVQTIAMGLAASMGSFLLTAGTKGKRYALPNAEILIHQPLGGARGQATDIQIQAKEIERMKELTSKILSECLFTISFNNLVFPTPFSPTIIVKSLTEFVYGILI